MDNQNWLALEKALRRQEELYWENPKYGLSSRQDLGWEDIEEAALRLDRFRPLIKKLFPETLPWDGLIESPLTEIPKVKAALEEEGIQWKGRLFLKRDSDLPIAGSVKARGGIYTVLKHAEALAKTVGFAETLNYSVLAEAPYRQLFQDHTIQVGSTGNLGLSIGIAGAALGFQVIVHMSQDAKSWKKELLRQHGVVVKEYASDYSLAVKEGRRLSEQDPKSFFVDDENSKDLFLGYAVAALRLKDQLESRGIAVDADHPLAVSLPCGVGGAPGGIAFGLKSVYGQSVLPYFIEPAACPAMLLGMASGKHDAIAVGDIGLFGQTQADGLAVGRPSGFVGRLVEPMIRGIGTFSEDRLVDYLKLLFEKEGYFVEPSAASAFHLLFQAARESWDKETTVILWATGGSLVPKEVRRVYLEGR